MHLIMCMIITFCKNSQTSNYEHFKDNKTISDINALLNSLLITCISSHIVARPHQHLVHQCHLR